MLGKVMTGAINCFYAGSIFNQFTLANARLISPVKSRHAGWKEPKRTVRFAALTNLCIQYEPYQWLVVRKLYNEQ